MVHLSRRRRLLVKLRAWRRCCLLERWHTSCHALPTFPMLQRHAAHHRVYWLHHRLGRELLLLLLLQVFSAIRWPGCISGRRRSAPKVIVERGSSGGSSVHCPKTNEGEMRANKSTAGQTPHNSTRGGF